jgi:PAS domain S-box-containing protein
MIDEGKSKDQLIKELVDLRQRVTQLEASQDQLARADKALLESEERFRTVSDFAYDWEYWIGPEGNYLYVSPSCERITGYGPDEFQKDPGLLKTITHPDERTEIENHIVKESEREEVRSIDFRIVTRNGTERWIGHLCQPVYSRDGRYLGRRASNRDITQRKRAEEALRQARDNLERQVRERTDDLGERVKEQTCLYGISALVDTPDISIEEIIQGTVDLIPHGWHYPEIACARIVLEEKEFRSAKFEESIWKQTTDMVVHGNPIGTVEVHYMDEKPEEDEGPFLREERSLINAIARRLEHAIEHREADEALAQLAAIVESSNDAIIGKTLDGIITSWNSGAEKIYGYSAQEAIGSPIAILVPPELPDDEPRFLERIKRGDRVDRHETVRFRKDGQRIDVSLTISPIKDTTGDIIGASTIARDITEHKRMQQALRDSDKLVTVGKLAAGVAHSIRNPLTSVKMRLFSMEGTAGLSESEREDLKVISEEIRQIDGIVRNFLEYSRRPRLTMQKVSPSEVVDLALNLLKQRLDSYGVEVRLSRQSSLPEIYADPDQLKEALVNLLVNASEAMGYGGSIAIAEEEVGDGPRGRKVVIRVSDNGPGFPHSIQDKLFEPFFTTKEEGTGLGLTIAARIIEEHGGKLELSSREGEGAISTISLPVKEEES